MKEKKLDKGMDFTLYTSRPNITSPIINSNPHIITHLKTNNLTQRPTRLNQKAKKRIDFYFSFSCPKPSINIPNNYLVYKWFIFSFTAYQNKIDYSYRDFIFKIFRLNNEIRYFITYYMMDKNQITRE